MTYSGRPSSPPPTMRQLRPNPLAWGAVFLILAGPFNPAAWLVAFVTDLRFSADNVVPFAWIVLLPSTVVALVVLCTIWRRQGFSHLNLWSSAFIGLCGGILAGPLGVTLGNFRDFASQADMMEFYFASLFLGTIFLIIPYFAVVFGIPCMFAVVAIGYLCSQPIDNAPNSVSNTKLPKPPKPL